MLRIVPLIALLLTVFPAPAGTVYRWVMPDGSVRFSDQPEQPGAVEGGPIDAAPAQTYAPAAAGAPVAVSPPPAALEPAPAAAPARDRAPDYETFVVVAPVDGEGVRVNSGNVPVRVLLEPALAEGHVIEIHVDGAVAGRGVGSDFVLDNVDRGAHLLHATISDETGALMRSTPTVTFSLIRTSLCNRRRKDFAGCAPRGPCECGVPVAVPLNR